MGGSIPLVALMGQQYQPESLLSAVGKAQAIKSSQQQQQQSSALFPGQLQQQQQQIQQNASDIAERAAVNKAYQGALTVDPQTHVPSIDRNKLLSAMGQSGVAGTAIPGTMKNMQDLDIQAQTLAKSKEQASTDEQDYMGAAARTIRDSGYDPNIENLTLNHAAALYPQEVQQLRQHLEQQPQTKAQLYNAMISQSPKEQALANSSKEASAKQLTAQSEMMKAQQGNFDLAKAHAWLNRPENAGKDLYDYQVQSKIDEQNAALPGEITKARAMGIAGAEASGRDYEAMIRNGVNPITKEKLTLDNAPDAMLVDAKGNPVPLAQQPLYKPTSQEKQTADTARQVQAISSDLAQEVQKNPNLIGPLMGRDQKALSALGYNSQQSQKMLDDVSLLQSAATKMHTGRFSNEILNKMSGMIDAHMDGPAFLGGLQSINNVASRYAKEDQLITVGEQKQLKAQGGGAKSNTLPGSGKSLTLAQLQAAARGEGRSLADVTAEAKEQGYGVP